ncbi:MAG: accessory factor UbiK family protein [Spongiibacteraceae bacterium]
MINRESIDKLTQQIGDLFGQSTLFGQNSVPQDIQRNLRALLQSGFDKMDLVTRDEFDAQTAVLERTRATLDKTEKQCAELEKQLNELAQKLNDPPR